jgi:hypothetical protein
LIALGMPSFVCVILGFTFMRPIEFVRARGDYFWFSGAHPDFLAHLPTWRHGK